MLALSERVFFYTKRLCILFSTMYIPGLRMSLQVSCLWTEYHHQTVLFSTTFRVLIDLYAFPKVDLFGYTIKHKLDHFLSKVETTPASGPPALMVDWNRLGSIFMFSTSQHNGVVEGSAVLVSIRYWLSSWLHGHLSCCGGTHVQCHWATLLF